MVSSAAVTVDPAPASGSEPPLLEIVIPVHNEERELAASVRRLRDHLLRCFPYDAHITIADNASIDATRSIGEGLAAELPRVSYLRLPEKGRGRALAAAWMRSDAEVVAYMDVDLSTDLGALLPLVAPLLTGESDIAIGSRLASGARVRRGLKRELISRIYNRILRATLGVGFRDAQCGFKALHSSVARELVPRVENRNWFFDTELLVLAEREGLRIAELPVTWRDDPDSRVHVAATAAEDLRGILRLLRSRGPHRVVRFAAIGVLSTVAYAGLLWALRSFLALPVANGVALLATAVANTAANRRFTFGVRGRPGVWRDHLAGLVAFAVALLITEGASVVLDLAVPRPARALEVTVLTAASASATLVRYLLLRRWFRGDQPRARAHRSGSGDGGASSGSSIRKVAPPPDVSLTPTLPP